MPNIDAIATAYIIGKSVNIPADVLRSGDEAAIHTAKYEAEQRLICDAYDFAERMTAPARLS